MAQIACTFTYKWDNQAFFCILLFFIWGILTSLKSFFFFFHIFNYRFFTLLTQGPYIISPQLNFSAIMNLCLNRIMLLAFISLFMPLPVPEDLYPSNLCLSSPSARTSWALPSPGHFLIPTAAGHPSCLWALCLHGTYHIPLWFFWWGGRGWIFLTVARTFNMRSIL